MEKRGISVKSLAFPHSCGKIYKKLFLNLRIGQKSVLRKKIIRGKLKSVATTETNRKTTKQK